VADRGEHQDTDTRIAALEGRLEKAQFYFQVIASWVVLSLALTVVFGWLIIAGLGSFSRTTQLWFLLVAGISLLASAILLKIQRDEVFSVRSDLRQMRAWRRNRKTPVVPTGSGSYESSRERYKSESWEYVEEARQAAARNRRVHNTFQAIIILGSILVTSLTSAMASADPVNWITIVLSILVSASAGLSSFFKFRERGFNLQQTANAIEKEYNAVELRIHDYGQLTADNDEALRVFAERVEALKEEQRNRELQLEQSADRTSTSPAGQAASLP